MSISVLLQAVFSGVTNGFIYGLLGMGIAVIFKGTRIVNAAHGEFAVIGAVVAVIAMKAAGFNYPVSFFAGALTGAATGIAIDFLLVRPMVRRHATDDTYLLLTIGLSFAISAALLYFGGREYHLLPSIGDEDVAIVLDATIRHHALWLIAISVVIVVALHAFFHHTQFGLAMMAASIDADGASATGINVQLMRTATFGLGGLLGAIAGLLIAPLVPVTYSIGLVFTLKGFCAAILGGLSNPVGAVVGGLTLGLLESLAIVFIASAYKDVVAMVLLIAIMIVMPHGMLGRAGRKGG
jgi:branched-chain amino acid transport system permease protein